MLNYSFDGNVFLFLIGIILISICTCLRRKIHIEDLTDHSNQSQFINKIRLFINVLNEKVEREYQFMIYQYLNHYLHKATQANTQKHLSHTGFPAEREEKAIVLNHLVNSFKEALLKYSAEPSIGIAYASFQAFYLNRKHQGYISLSAFTNSQLTLKEEFTVFRNRSLLEEGSGNASDEDFDPSDFMHSHRFSLFVKAIEESIVSYEALWNFLLKSHTSKESNVKELVKLLHQTRYSIDQVDINFQDSITFNPPDQRLIRLYEKYQQCYAHDTSKAQQYKNDGVALNDNHVAIEEMIKRNNINNINSIPDFLFLIASGEANSLGKILNISLKLCSLCGYSQKELNGKNIDMLIPDFLKSEHRAMLSERLSQQINDTQGAHQRKELFVLLKTKTQYLLPIDVQISLLYNESNQLILFAKLIPHSNQINNISTFYIMTDHQLKIQSFSLEAISHLHLSSKVINSSHEITYFIKEFYEKYHTEVTETPHSDKLKIKRKLVEGYYSVYRDITWKNKEKREEEYNHLKYNDMRHGEKDSEYNSLLPNAQNVKMKAKPIRMHSIEGFIFIFESFFSSLTPKAVSHAKPCQLPMTFIPEGIKLAFEPNKKAFLLFTQPEQGIEQYAKEKMKEMRLNDKKDSEEASSDYSSSMAYSSEASQTSSQQELSSVSNTEPNKKVLQGIQLPQKEEFYFKVNTSKIRLSIYDFKKRIFIDSQPSKFDKIEELRKSETASLPIQDKSLFTKKHSNKKMIDLPSKSTKQNKQQGSSHILFKINSTSIIIRYTAVHFVIFFTSILFSVLYFNSLFTAANELENVGLYLNNHFHLEVNIIYSSFYATELSLLSNDKFTNYNNTTEDYRAYCVSYLHGIYHLTNEKINQLLQYESHLSVALQDKFHKTYVKLKIINSRLSITEYPINLYSSILEVNTAAYRLSSSPTENQTLLNVDYHLISFNGENVNLPALLDTLEFSFEELHNIIWYYTFTLWMYYAGFIVMCCLFWCWSLFEIRKIRREQNDHLNVFFIISESLIKKAIDASAEFKECYTDNKFNEMSSKDFLVNDKPHSETPSASKEATVIEERPAQLSIHSKNNKKCKDYVGTLLAHLVHYLLLFCVITFNTISYTQILRKIPEIVNVSHNQSSLELNFLEMYNYLRNYILYCTTNSKEALFYETHLKQSIVTSYSFLQFTLNETITSITEHKILDKKTNKIFEKIYFQSLCPLFDKALFTLPSQARLVCESLMNNVTSFGLNYALPHYVELIRHLTRITDEAKKIALSSGFTYNEFVFGTEKYEEIASVKSNGHALYQEKNPFFLLSGKIARDISMLWKYVIRPAFQTLSDAFYELLVNTIAILKINSTIAFSCYYAILVLYYLLYYLPAIKSITADLQKTKKLISIIPSDVLEACM